MRYQKPVIIGASVLAFGAAVAVMLPPTTPIGGAKITSTSHQGFAPVKAAQPAESQPSYQSFAADAAPAPVDRQLNESSGSTTNEVAVADDEGDTGSRAVLRPQAPPVQLAMAPPSPRPRPMLPPRADPRFAYADDPADDDGRDYKQGYRWARRADVHDWRECRALGGDQVNGCRAYIRDMAQRTGDDEEDDRPY